MCPANKYSFPFNLKSSTKEKKVIKKTKTVHPVCCIQVKIMATYYQVNNHKEDQSGMVTSKHHQIGTFLCTVNRWYAK